MGKVLKLERELQLQHLDTLLAELTRKLHSTQPTPSGEISAAELNILGLVVIIKSIYGTTAATASGIATLSELLEPMM